jgi:multidrug resistance efflux pump
MQVEAKAGAIDAYGSKVTALDDQIEAMRQELVLKQGQLEAKVKQVELKLLSTRADYQQARVALDIAGIQYRRTDTLYRQGIEPRNELENKQQKLQEAQAKAVAAENKVEETENELRATRLELRNLTNEYNSKIAKSLSDRFSTLSELYNAEGELNKTRIQYENYAQRSQFYYILAPQDCYITKAIKPGIGETVKEGDPIVSIMPSEFTIAAELYIRPVDLPLIQMGNEVRFIFDGWPAFVFSGWPNQSVGTYTGRVVAIDNTINEKGEYRILAAPSAVDRPWPEALRPGSGARGIALLNTVPVWYEIWRKLNGFPPDYYVAEEEEGKQEDKKTKLGDAPVKDVVK